MSYRTFKRALGETSLERKCRVLFGASLLLLITAAFWYAGWTAEKLVRQGPLRTGRFFVTEKMQSFHVIAWVLEEAPKQAAQKLNDALGSQNFGWEILVLDMDGVKQQLQEEGQRRIRKANSGDEEKWLVELQADIDSAFEDYGRHRLRSYTDVDSAAVVDVRQETSIDTMENVGQETPSQETDDPVELAAWTTVCRSILNLDEVVMQR